MLADTCIDNDDASRIEKPIPSLQEMCAKSLGKKAGAVSHAHVRNMLLGAHQSKTKSISAQISRLQQLLKYYENYLKAEIEQNNNRYGSYWLLTWTNEYNKETKKYEYHKEFKLLTRNIWEEDMFTSWQAEPENGRRILPITMSWACTNPTDALSGTKTTFHRLN